ncbi:MAG: dTDP-4-dehydrorhamnose reductase [Ignavibacteria bacterium RBG_16_34_14]|nr:MAG: dTDP-4-dehydrorhamnose reductase [Ignavibacteria bacterium RBG_16_34_14]
MFSRNLIKKRILVTGANGMLGQSLCRFYSKQKNVRLLACSIDNESVFNGIDYSKCDLTKREAVKKIVLDFYPDYIVNAAAYTNVDKSEIEREEAWKVNVKGVEYLSETARIIDSRIIHISTDYIFDGKTGPYSEDDKPSPLGYYARTKLASENVLKISGVLYSILRSNVLYGSQSNCKIDFVMWLVNSLREEKEVRIVTDQINNPTFVEDLVQGISKVIEYNKTGVYNIGGREFLSRYEFSQIIADFFRLDKSLIKPVSTGELNQQARRPLKSGLITLKAETELGYKPLSIKESLAVMKKELLL